MQRGNGIYYSTRALKAQHVSSSHSDLTMGGHHTRM